MREIRKDYLSWLNNTLRYLTFCIKDYIHGQAVQSDIDHFIFSDDINAGVACVANRSVDNAADFCWPCNVCGIRVVLWNVLLFREEGEWVL